MRKIVSWLILSAAVSCSGCSILFPPPPPCPPIPPQRVISIPDLPPLGDKPAWQPVTCGFTLCLDDKGTDNLLTQLQMFEAERDTCRKSYSAMQKLYGPTP